MGKRGDGVRQRRYLTFHQLCERWGGCSLMTLENKLRKDPNFPKAIKLPGGRLRLFLEEEVERYERAAVVTTRKMAEA
jgi:predicted DNA-binding transcriptional regulator AlpA